MEDPTPQEIMEETIQALDLSEAEADRLRLYELESFNKAMAMIQASKDDGTLMSIRQGDEFFVNTQWIEIICASYAQLFLGGYEPGPDAFKILEMLTDILYAVKIHQKELDSTEPPVLD